MLESCLKSLRAGLAASLMSVAVVTVMMPASTAWAQTRALPDFTDFMVFFKPGDIVKFHPVNELEYRRIHDEVDQGTFTYRQAPVVFDLQLALEDPAAHNQQILEALYGA